MGIEFYRCQRIPCQKSEVLLSEVYSLVHLKNNVALLLRKSTQVNGFQRDENLFFFYRDGWIYNTKYTQ